MSRDDHLSKSVSICRLFPLPGVVLFPHAVLPLHIFEPRYRQMTQDALASDKLVTIVQLKPGGDASASRPELEEVGCLGRILSHERLPDGRFNFLLLGLKRVRLVHELPSNKLYRVARAELLDEEAYCELEAERRAELVRLFRAIAERQQPLSADLETLLSTDISLAALSDIIAHALGLPPDLKQYYLNDCSVERRVDGLVEILGDMADAVAGMPEPACVFPPPFSMN